jgi:hypothetical protein
MSLTAAISHSRDPRWWKPLLSGTAAGLALACKISIVYVLPLIGLLLVFEQPWNSGLYRIVTRNTVGRLLAVTSFGLAAFLAVRIGDPHLFEHPEFWKPLPSQQFLKNIRELQAMNNVGDGIPFPPGVQWMETPPVLFALRNLVLVGLGIPTTLLAAWGILVAARGRRPIALVILGWMLLFFLYQSTQSVKTMRYFLVLYPLLAVFAAYGASTAVSLLPRGAPRWGAWSVIALAVCYWPWCFMQIYTRPHSRVTASYWIYQNIPAGSMIATEHWDDPLPLLVPEHPHRFRGEQLEIFGEDSPGKWANLNRVLDEADYIIFSSNRGYGSMGTRPHIFPVTAKFYRDLFEGRREFELVHEVVSFPGRDLGFFDTTYDDQGAEEAFSVYDHPKVSIFKRRMPKRPAVPFQSPAPPPAPAG